MFTLIEQGEVYGPEPLGKTSVLLNGGTILKVGEVQASSVEQLSIPFDVIDASTFSAAAVKKVSARKHRRSTPVKSEELTEQGESDGKK